MICYAHSARDGAEAQTYSAHIENVCELARRFSAESGAYSRGDGALLQKLAAQAAQYHDLGKLDEANQRVLSGKVKAAALPVDHVDAGSAYWLEDSYTSVYAAAAIYSHHCGYPDFTSEQNRGELIFRDGGIAEDTDRKLARYEQIHRSQVVLPDEFAGAVGEEPRGDRAVFLRMLLSCLADADHTDTARCYGKYPSSETPVPLRAKERLAQLDLGVRELRMSGKDSERNRLRGEMYDCCRTAVSAPICSCDSPVGSGKTTAVMANLLAQADKYKLRRIFVVLPYTNIIRQSVKTYRRMLALPGEKPEEAVAELHCRADFENEDERHLTALWRAPIIVTTSVAFFETLASDTPAALRRLHELPGSGIFVDEAHAAVPAGLLGITWRWMNVLADDWGCRWILASGSLCRFWTIKEIAAGPEPREVPEIAAENIRRRLMAYENRRVIYRYQPRPMAAAELAEWVLSFPGPRLVILNSVQSAAVLADELQKSRGRGKVEHLSTALKPDDREKTLERVRGRLNDPDDADWTLVATSCVEAGVDISFRTGFRELCPLASLIQAAGRINREGIYSNAEIWTFRIAEDGLLKLNPGMKHGGEVLKRIFESGAEISPVMTTGAIREEIALYGTSDKNRTVMNEEEDQDFRSVEKHYKVIDSDTRLAVVDAGIADKLRAGKTDWKELQNEAVQISKHKLDEFGVPAVLKDIYFWDLGYDDFLGYMAGVLRAGESGSREFIV